MPSDDGPIVAVTNAVGMLPEVVDLPPLPEFVRRDPTRADYGTKNTQAGFSLALWVRFDTLAAGQVLLDNRGEERIGFCLQTTDHDTLEIILNDGRTENRWDCDPGMLETGKLHHLVVIVDGGPKIITFVTDGILNDGGEVRQFGWGRFNPNLRSASSFSNRGIVDADAREALRIGPTLKGEVQSLRVYDRALRTAEAIALYRQGK